MNNNKYLRVAASISPAETEAALRTWLRSGEAGARHSAGDIKILSVEDIHLPMSVTYADSWGRWSLTRAVFQEQDYNDALDHYENECDLYQEEEKKYVAAREGGGHYPLALMPQPPKRDDYFSQASESSDYKISFTDIYRAFGEDALGKAKSLSREIAETLDKLIRKGMPKAEAVSRPPTPVEQALLTAQIEKQVNDKSLEYAKQQAKKYENAKTLSLADVNYKCECNIVFLPIRLVEYICAGKTNIAVADPIRNEYILGVRPAASRRGGGAVIAAAAAAVIILTAGTLYWEFGPGNAAGHASVAPSPALPPQSASANSMAAPVPKTVPAPLVTAPAATPAPPSTEVNIAMPALASPAAPPLSPAPSIAVPVLAPVPPSPPLAPAAANMPVARPPLHNLRPARHIQQEQEQEQEQETPSDVYIPPPETAKPASAPVVSNAALPAASAPESKYQREKQSFIAAWGSSTPAAAPLQVPVAPVAQRVPPEAKPVALAKPKVTRIAAAAPAKAKPVRPLKNAVPSMPNVQYQNDKQNFIKAWGSGT